MQNKNSSKKNRHVIFKEDSETSKRAANETIVLENTKNTLSMINDVIASEESSSKDVKQPDTTQDNVSVVSTLKEDSLLLEAKNNINSPSPSDHEGVSPGRLSNFFTISELGSAMEIPDQISEFKSSAKKYLDQGNKYRLKANMLFKKNKFKDALGEYLKAVEELDNLLNFNKKDELLNMTNINWVRMECFNSIAVCYLLMKEYDKVLQYTSEVLKINSNNFIALSYRAKALIAKESYKEALEVIKNALSVKYSKSLIMLLKDVEERLNPLCQERKKNINSITTDSHSNEEGSPENNIDTGVNNFNNDDEKKSQRNSNKPFYISVLISILKFLKIFSIGFLETIKKYKFGLLVLLIIYIIVFRKRLKSKLFSILRIKFN